MEENRDSSSLPPTATATTASNDRREGESLVSRMKKNCLSFAASVQEGCQNLNARLIGQVKTLTAKDEREATEADLGTAKMEVEAADAAEQTKKRLGTSK